MLLTWLHGDLLRVDGGIHDTSITVDGMAGEADCVFGMIVGGINSNRWQVPSCPSSRVTTAIDGMARRVWSEKANFTVYQAPVAVGAISHHSITQVSWGATHASLQHQQFTGL